jgi:hypothetical protein
MRLHYLKTATSNYFLMKTNSMRNIYKAVDYSYIAILLGGINMAAKKYYEMKVGSTKHVFTGKSPRQAALKAAARGFGDIKLRERGRRNKDGTYSIHKFKGSVSMINAPANRPSWLPAQVKKPIVKKAGVDRVKKF